MNNKISNEWNWKWVEDINRKYMSQINGEEPAIVRLCVGCG